MKMLGRYWSGIGIVLLCAAGAADGAVFTGAYTPLGNTTGTGPWTLTSTNSTFSSLRLTTNEHPTFANVTNINVVFNSPDIGGNTGGGGGAPRLAVSLDTNGDNVSNGFIVIHLGTSPNFIDTPANLSALSGLNLINGDAGRYDLSNFGGSNFTDHASAVALVGTATVLRMTVILDSFGGNDKTLVVTSINGEFTGEQAAPVPEPASLLAWSILGLAAGGGWWRRRRSPSK